MNRRHLAKVYRKAAEVLDADEKMTYSCHAIASMDPCGYDSSSDEVRIYQHNFHPSVKYLKKVYRETCGEESCELSREEYINDSWWAIPSSVHPSDEDKQDALRKANNDERVLLLLFASQMASTGDLDLEFPKRAYEILD